MVQRRILIATVLLSSLLLWAAAAVTVRASWRVANELAHAATLAEIGPHPQSTVVFDRQNRPVFSFYVEQRIDVPLDRVSPRMIDALLAVEDRRFYSHHGLDAVRIAKAAWRNWRAGRIVEGGSTLTQQLARLEALSPVRTFSRKIREATIAVRLEERYSKQEILNAYLNAVYFGDGYYGVEAASRGYFGKPASELQPHEAALLAGIVRSPTGYSPSGSPKRALARRNLVLRLMRDTGRLTESEYRGAIETPLRASATLGAVTAANTACGRYFQEEVRRQLVARFGGQQVLQGGLRVYTGYDREMQCAAEKTITSRIEQIVKTRKGARDLEGSLVALDPASGEVRALVGGRDFGASSYIRATQAHRQPGSAFKPIIYAVALERGMAPASVLHHLDEPIMTANGPWLPSGEHELPEYSLRAALKISSNRAAAQLLQQVGYSQAAYYAQRMGIESRLPAVASLALGTGGVTRAVGVGRCADAASGGHAGDRVPHEQHACGRAHIGDRHHRARRRIHAARSGKDRDDRQLHGRVVRRLHPAPGDRRVVRHGPARPDHESRVRGGGRGAGVGRFHEAGDGEGRARLVPASRGRRENHDLPPERPARHRCVPQRLEPRLRAGRTDRVAGRSRRQHGRHVGPRARRRRRSRAAFDRLR
jgi:membrane peptidoglycan carboxypeptidase